MCLVESVPRPCPTNMGVLVSQHLAQPERYNNNKRYHGNETFEHENLIFEDDDRSTTRLV
jgi:hypothetical protein